MQFRGKYRFLLVAAVCIFFLAAEVGFAQAETRPIAKGHKEKVTGTIVVHDGDVVQVLDGRDGSAYSFKVTDKTTIRCDKGFLRGKTVMDASALVPALTIEVEAIGSQDMAEARTIRFSPDTFAFVPTQDQQSGDLCHQPAQDPGRSHGVRTLLSSILPPL